MAKVDLVTGFLGAGKTTFILDYAKDCIAKGERVGIIENDYGAVNIDMVLLQEELGDACGLEMVIGGDGIEAHRRRLKTKLIAMGMMGYSRIIVEPSGIFDVDEFFDLLYEEPLDRWYEKGSVITLVDATLSTQTLTKESRYILVSQLAEAGAVVLNKCDLATEDTLQKTWDMVGTALEEFGCKRDFAMVMAKPADAVSLTAGHTQLIPLDFDKLRSAGHVHQDHIKLPVLEEGAYGSVYLFDVQLSKEQTIQKIKKLFADSEFGKVIRVKGHVRTPDGVIELNGTKEQVEEKTVPDCNTVLIVIGETLDKARIENEFSDNSNNY